MWWSKFILFLRWSEIFFKVSSVFELCLHCKIFFLKQYLDRIIFNNVKDLKTSVTVNCAYNSKQNS